LEKVQQLYYQIPKKRDKQKEENDDEEQGKEKGNHFNNPNSNQYATQTPISMPHWPQSCFGSIFVSPSREHLIKAYLHMNASSVKGIQCVNCAKMRDELLSGRRNGNGNFR